MPALDDAGNDEVPSPAEKNLFEKYEVGRLLGYGAFAKVYHARDVRTEQSVAIKSINKQRILKGGLAANVKREISIMHRLRHPNIVRLLEVLANKKKIYFVLEYAKGGELFAKVAKSRFSEHLSRRYFQQLISAVGYCHSRGVYHRDLKPENLLLDENWNLKVTDFGLSALTDQIRPDGLLHTLCGTPAYVAPEILAKKGYDGVKVDIWSCGIILYVLNAGYLPFNDPNLMVMYRKIYNGDFRVPRWTSPDLKRLISRLLDTNPETRITVDEIINDPWFKIGYKQVEFHCDHLELKDDDDDENSVTGDHNLKRDFVWLSLTIRSKVALCEVIRGRLTERAEELFRMTPFGRWLDVQSYGGDAMLINLFLQRQVEEAGAEPETLYYDIGGHRRRYGREEFLLITGLPFGVLPDYRAGLGNAFIRRLFPHALSQPSAEAPFRVKISAVYDMFEEMDDLSDEDKVRICCIIMVELVFLGRQPHQYVSPEVVRAVHDLDALSEYPWGSFIWSFTYRHMNSAFARRTDGVGNKMSISGFLYAFKIWILEMFPVSSRYFATANRYPRGIRWERKQKVLHKDECLAFFRFPKRSRHPRERLIADEFEERQAWYRESHAWFQNPASLRPPKRVRRVPEAGDPSDDDDDDDAPPRDDPHEAGPSHRPMDWDPYEQKWVLLDSVEKEQKRQLKMIEALTKDVEKLQVSSRHSYSGPSGGRMPAGGWMPPPVMTRPSPVQSSQHDAARRSYHVPGGTTHGMSAMFAPTSFTQPAYTQPRASGSFLSGGYGMDPSSYLTPPPYPQPGPEASGDAGTSWDAITSAAEGILTGAGGFQAFLDTYGGMSGQAGSTYGGGVTTAAETRQDTVMTPVTTAAETRQDTVMTPVTTAAENVTTAAETRQVDPQIRQEKGKAKTKGKTKQQAVARPQREKKKAPGISTPFTLWSSSWKGPQSSNAMELVPAEDIERYYLRNQMPLLNLSCYTDAAVDRSWWGVLFGHEDSGNLLDSHIDAWRGVILESRAEGSDWTVMSAQFVEWLERSGPSAVCSMVDGTSSRHVGWDVLLRVLIPICIHPRHWILADLNLTTMKIVVYDSYRIEPLRQAVEEKLQKFMAGVRELLKLIRQRERVAATRKFSWTFASNVPQQNSPLGDCGVWICKFMSDLVTNQTPARSEHAAADALSWRRSMVEAFYCRRITPGT